MPVESGDIKSPHLAAIGYGALRTRPRRAANDDGRGAEGENLKREARSAQLGATKNDVIANSD